MDITFTQVIYALTFIFVILIIEGGYLFILSRNSRERVVNRRMKLVRNSEIRTLDPSILKRRINGGAVSKLLVGVFPSLADMLSAADIRISPAGFGGICAAVFMLGLIVAAYVLGTANTFRTGYGSALRPGSAVSLPEIGNFKTAKTIC